MPDDLRLPLGEILPPVSTERARWTRKIGGAWRAALDAILETGRQLIAAKDALPHGEFGEMIKSDLPFADSTARRLMTIASDERLANRAHAHVLPPAWSTLYELTKLDDETFTAKIADGSIRSDLERRKISEWLKPEKKPDPEAAAAQPGNPQPPSATAAQGASPPPTPAPAARAPAAPSPEPPPEAAAAAAQQPPVDIFHPTEGFAADLRTLVLHALAERPFTEWPALIARLRDEIDDIERELGAHETRMRTEGKPE